MGEPLDPVCEALLVFGSFGTPTTKRVDFDAVIGGKLAHEARELLRVATQFRDSLVDGLDNSGHAVDPRNVVGGVENYLPHIYKITHSMEASASAQIRLNKPLSFSWTSVLTRAKAREYSCGVLVYEVCFVLTIQALAHYSVAKQMLAPEQRSRLTSLVAAVKELRRGAGILEFVSQVLLPRWVSPPDKRPPEVVSSVVAALSTLFLLMAQRVTVVQAIQKKSPPTALAKLLLGLSERYAELNRQLLALDRPLYDSLLPQLVDEPPLFATVCFSLGLKFLGEHARKEQKAGQAVAYMHFASDNLVKATYTAPMAEIYRARLDANRRAVDEQFHAFKADNESIYFDGVPTRDRLEIPQGQFIIKPDDYSLPEVEAVSFASKDVEKEAEASAKPAPAPEQRKSLSSWFSKPAGATPAPAAPTPAAHLKCPKGYSEDVWKELPDDIKQEIAAAQPK